jgi:putative nucleotidyltransferase with HDIG domain
MKSPKANLYIGLVIAGGTAILGHGLWTWSSANVRRYLVYAIIAVVASGLKVSLPSVKGTMSMSFLFVLIGISEFSLGESLAMGCLGMLVQSIFLTKTRPKPIRVAFSVASVACAIQIAYSVHHAWELHNGLLTAIAYFVANTLLVATVIALTERQSVWRVWRDSYFWSFPNYLVGAAAAWVVSAASHFIGWEAALLLLPIFYVVYQSHNLYIGRLEEAKRRAEEQLTHAEEVAALHRRTIETLALAIEAKDQTTHDHLERVEIYAVEVARELGFGQTEIEALRAAALLHDIGKLAVPEYIISKPGKLTPEEFEKMKTHTVMGAEMVERIRFPYAVAPMVRGHHEKWDGTGYPDGLAGEQIPIGARILSAVDCLDALSSDRQYRRALPLEEAIKVVQAESGKSFDAKVVDILARRYVELDRMAKSSNRIAKLPTGVRIARGEAPAAGFEKIATGAGKDLVNFHNSISAAGRRAQRLGELNAALTDCAGQDAAFAALNASLRLIVPYDAMAVYIRRGEILSPQGTDGDDFRGFTNVEAPLGSGLSGWVAENGKAIINGNPSVEPGYLNDPPRFSALKSALAVPLSTSRGMIGVVSLYRTEPDAFTSDHLASLTSLAAALAGALELAAQDESATAFSPRA